MRACGSVRGWDSGFEIRDSIQKGCRDFRQAFSKPIETGHDKLFPNPHSPIPNPGFTNPESRIPNPGSSRIRAEGGVMAAARLRHLVLAGAAVGVAGDAARQAGAARLLGRA